VGDPGILLYWVSRVLILTHRGEMHDDPVVFAARDRASLNLRRPDRPGGAGEHLKQGGYPQMTQMTQMKRRIIRRWHR